MNLSSHGCFRVTAPSLSILGYKYHHILKFIGPQKMIEWITWRDAQRMDQIISTILKEQNRALLCAVADMCGLSQEDILNKYWTPTFYIVGHDNRNIYEITEKTTCKTKIMRKK
jgi:hypothetical protein